MALLVVRLLQYAAWGIGVCSVHQPTTPPEFPTAWEVPPGDPAELGAAGLTKVLCSAVFITGCQLAAAMEDDGLIKKAAIVRGQDSCTGRRSC